ncbi:MAG: ankyrin repeat domain-containing protein [Rhodocyclaceae bacterium]
MRTGTEFPIRTFRHFIALALACCLIGVAHADSYEDSLSSARLGDTRQLVNLLNRGIDPNTVDDQGNTLLMLAVRDGHVRTVEAILQYRPNVAHRNIHGDSALMVAALRGDVAMAEMLLAGGAELDHEGWTPLMYAAFEGHAELVDRFIELGANVNAEAPNGGDALMFAARNGHIQVVRRLLTTDVDLDRQNDRGFTAETWALSNANTDIADLINRERARRGGRPSTLTIEIE